RRAARRLEILETRRQQFMARKYLRMHPRMRPQEPLAATAVAPDHREPEQVIEPAPVDADIHHIAAREDRFESDRLLLRLPELRADPIIRQQRKPDFDVEVLRVEPYFRFRPGDRRLERFALEKFRIDRCA